MTGSEQVRRWTTYRVVWLLNGSPCSSTDGMARDSAIHTARSVACQPRTSDVRIESRQHVATVTEFAVNDEATKEALSDV